jgi:hypothetical protein
LGILWRTIVESSSTHDFVVVLLFHLYTTYLREAVTLGLVVISMVPTQHTRHTSNLFFERPIEHRERGSDPGFPFWKGKFVVKYNDDV